MKSKATSSAEITRRKQYSAPALEKGLDILELLAGEAEGLNLSEIAKRLNRSVGELFRMLAVLEQRGYATLQPGTDRYALTLRLFGLAHRFAPVKRLTASAGPIMRRLAYDIEQSCHLVVYYEGKGHVVVQQDSPSERVFSVRLGAEAPLINTCSGHILLTFVDRDERERMLEKIPEHHPQADSVEVEKIIKRVRQRGYESVSSAQARGVKDIGYPVFDHTGNVIAALVVPFLAYIDGSHPVEIGQATKLVGEAARHISRLLGHQSG